MEGFPAAAGTLRSIQRYPLCDPLTIMSKCFHDRPRLVWKPRGIRENSLRRVRFVSQQPSDESNEGIRFPFCTLYGLTTPGDCFRIRYSVASGIDGVRLVTVAVKGRYEILRQTPLSIIILFWKTLNDLVKRPVAVFRGSSVRFSTIMMASRRSRRRPLSLVVRKQNQMSAFRFVAPSPEGFIFKRY